MGQGRRQWLQRAATAATALCAPALVGCSRRGSAGPLRFWAMGSEAEALKAMLPAFHAAHPGITVQVDGLPWSAAHEKLLTAFAGDALPDAAQLGNSWLPEFAALGALAPLDDWVAATPGLDPADWFSGIWQTNLASGAAGGPPRLLGLPWYVDTRLLFYRSDLLAAAGVSTPPATWSAWVATLDALQRAGTRHPLLLPINEFEPLLALALQQREPLLREGGRFGNFRSAGFGRALAFYLQRFASGHAAALGQQQIANLWQEFGRGTFAMFISGPWNIGELDRRLGPDARPCWSTLPLPAPDDSPQRPGASTAGGASLVVFAASPRQAQARALLAWLAQPAQQLRLQALTGNLPPRRSAWQQPAAAGLPLAQEPRMRAFAQQLEQVRPAPAVPEWERIVQEMQQLAQRAVAGRLGAPELQAALDARVDAFLEKRRWMLARSAA